MQADIRNLLEFYVDKFNTVDFIASDPVWAKKFADAGVPIVGDDIKSQVGATITHRVMAKLFEDRGDALDRTYQLNVGGNMDFNEIREGATVYLPVSQPGALLYLGDAHALQGDGETTQWALETSLDVEVKVELLKQHAITTPRVESATQIMTLGQGGSSDDALRIATSGMLQWLRQAYGLTLSEATQVLGVAVQYQVANLAGRSVGVAAKLDKAVLRTLPPAAPVT